jgi:hypothetical protein
MTDSVWGYFSNYLVGILVGMKKIYQKIKDEKLM